MMRLTPAALLFTTALAALPASAQDLRSEMEARAQREQLQRMAESDPDGFLANLIGTLFRLAPDGRLTAEAAQTAQRIEAATRRAQLLAAPLAFDLDGDLSISAGEVGTLRGALSGPQRATFETLLAVADANGNGAVSSAELSGYAASQMDERVGRRSEVDMLFVFDVDGDETVTLDELREGVRLLAAGALPDPACALLPPSPGAEIVLLSAYEGTMLSTVAVASQDETTTAARLTVEPGSAPLYVVASPFGSILWAFDGEVGRIERVVAGIDEREVGVAGIPADRVSFVPVQGCLPGWISEPTPEKEMMAKEALAQQLGREVEHIVASYSMGEVAIPSGERLPVPPPSPDDPLEQLVAGALAKVGSDEARRGAIAGEAMEARRFDPAGLFAIDPDAVVARREVKPYEVLPQQAGMVQLLGTGALEPTPQGYRVVAPIPRFPPGLHGAHLERFLITPGVPLPPGSAGHSDVVDETTGECLSGPRCLMP